MLDHFRSNNIMSKETQTRLLRRTRLLDLVRDTGSSRFPVQYFFNLVGNLKFDSGLVVFGAP